MNKYCGAFKCSVLAAGRQSIGFQFVTLYRRSSTQVFTGWPCNFSETEARQRRFFDGAFRVEAQSLQVDMISREPLPFSGF